MRTSQSAIRGFAKTNHNPANDAAVPSGGRECVTFGPPLSMATMSFGKSLLPLVLLTAISSVGSFLMAVHGHRIGDPAALVWQFAFRILVATSVYIDRKARGIALPFEFDAFVFWAWPLAVPYYLYRCRGPRGLVAALGICGLYVLPGLISTIILAPFPK